MASPNELSFLPDDYLERKAQRRTNVICALLFMVVMGAIGTAFTITERSGRAVEAEHSSVERKYTEAAKRIQLKQDLEKKQATMERQAELSASLLEKVPRSFMLAKVTNSLPAGVSLIEMIMESKLRTAVTSTAGAKPAFEQKRSKTDPKKDGAGAKDAPAAPLQQAKVYDVNLKITGVALTDVHVAQFIAKLNTLNIFKDVNLVISDEYKDTEEGRQLRKFSLEASLNPNAEITAADQEPTKTAAVEIK